MRRSTSLVLLLIAIAGIVVASSAYYLITYRRGPSLPPGCEKPPDGFLILVSQQGYNGSISHTNSWPVITVQSGTAVNMIVCNVDTQAHGFQVGHYYDQNIETLGPNQVLKVSFIADKVGTFKIYCSIFCTIHAFMQNGELNVH